MYVKNELISIKIDSVTDILVMLSKFLEKNNNIKTIGFQYTTYYSHLSHNCKYYMKLKVIHEIKDITLLIILNILKLF